MRDADLTATSDFDGRERRPPTSHAASGSRFEAGTLIAGRYRIVALLGEGGMGEVYRADDLTLGQSVALKFLSARVSTDPLRLERLRKEVRLTRQISHPNVCRVYDIGEAEGHHFLAMEFIDGEDLSALIRRIGRLPGEKATEIARQICAGLAVAHEQGVIHRDLKPSNIMIDGRGKARITDFGVAALSEELAGGDEAPAGTPAYMAPEQLEGREATRRSDIYALGLTLYELFTGKPAIAAQTLAELRDWHKSSAPPSSPSSIVTDIDPVAERVILRCLAPDPAERPASVMAVMAALPGSDPLRAMMEAGMTPSPDLVAASGRSGSLSVRVAAILAVVALVGMGIAFALISSLPFHQLAGGMLPPDVLEYRAKEMLTGLGFDEPPRETAHGLGARAWGQRQGETMDPVRERFAEDVPGVFFFWYRQHSGLLTPMRSTLPASSLGERISLSDPPMTSPGMITMELSPKGRLLRFERVTATRSPPESKEAAPDTRAMDWAHVLATARLEEFQLEECPPERIPKTGWDERRAWRGARPQTPERVIRVEAASLDGRLTSFSVTPDDPAPSITASGDLPPLSALIARVLVLLGLFGGGALALHNIRLGRGDRRGAARLGVFFFATSMLGWVFASSHSASIAAEAQLVISGVSYTIVRTLLACTLYMGLEPYIRKLLPTSLVGWSRLLAGKWRDPIVGRDILIALAASGICWAGVSAAGMATGLKGVLTGVQLPAPELAIASYLRAPMVAVGTSLLWMMFFVVTSVTLKKPRWLAPVVFWLILAGLISATFGTGTNSIYLGTIVVIGATVYTLVLYRFGLLPFFVLATTQSMVLDTPFTLDFSAWYSTPTIVLGALIALLTGFGFMTATAGGRAPVTRAA